MAEDREDEFELNAEVVEELLLKNFGVGREAFEAMSFEERVAAMLGSGRAYACTANIAPLDQDGNPVTEGGETSPTRH